MTDTVQAVLIFVVVILTILLVVLGVQAFFILRDFRKTVKKTNKVLDDTGVITESVSGPVSKLSTIMSGLKAGAIIASLLRNRKKKKQEDE
ncbi:MAG: hypothetical protein Q8P10_00925 [bacterium]|nr:hypothetical protein [bacterium]